MTDPRGKWVFLSGPMTGKPDFNRKAFDDAARQLADMGAGYVFNPADVSRRDRKAKPHEEYMKRTLHELTGGGYDLLVLLDGWQASTGSTLEVSVAQACGIPTAWMRDLSNCERMDADRYRKVREGLEGALQELDEWGSRWL